MKSASALDTPMMRQYLSIKKTQREAVLFYRMGDFYELFLEDAERVAPLLDLTLTTRDKGKPDAIPMCGVPVHSADGYVKRLAELGYRVAICEQVETPSATRGRVSRLSTTFRSSRPAASSWDLPRMSWGGPHSKRSTR